MVPLIEKAFSEGLKPTDHGGWSAGNTWRMGRTGHIAAMLCFVDPLGFEPESSMDLHGDIEYLYTIEAINHQGGNIEEMPTWKLSYEEEGEMITKMMPAKQYLKP